VRSVLIELCPHTRGNRGENFTTTSGIYGIVGTLSGSLFSMTFCFLGVSFKTKHDGEWWLVRTGKAASSCTTRRSFCCLVAACSTVTLRRQHGHRLRRHLRPCCQESLECGRAKQRQLGVTRPNRGTRHHAAASRSLKWKHFFFSSGPPRPAYAMGRNDLRSRSLRTISVCHPSSWRNPLLRPMHSVPMTMGLHEFTSDDWIRGLCIHPPRLWRGLSLTTAAAHISSLVGTLK
jgi:hypothetical protein